MAERHWMDTPIVDPNARYTMRWADGRTEERSKHRVYNPQKIAFVIKNGMRCYYCSRLGVPDQGPDGRVWHREHRIPKSRGGTGIRGNIVLSCQTCKLRKHDMDADAFREWAQWAYSGIELPCTLPTDLNPDPFFVGDVVEHPLFGTATITSIDLGGVVWARFAGGIDRCLDTHYARLIQVGSRG